MNWLKNNLVVVLVFVQLCTPITAQRNRDIDVYDIFYAQGLGQMNDLNSFGLDWYFAHSIADTRFKIIGRFSLGNTKAVVEHLPMYSDDFGFDDNMKVVNKGIITKMGLGLRYSPMAFYEWKLPILPYFQLGFGRLNYRQAWGARNVIEYIKDDGDGYISYPKYGDQGSILRNWTLYGSLTVGVMFPYTDLFDRVDLYFGFSIDYEFGGYIKYANPPANSDHFFYESGLGEELNRPFSEGANSNNSAFYNIARHQQLIFRLTPLRIEF